MPVKPDFTPFRVTNVQTSTNHDILVSAVKFTTDVSFFQRPEFSNQVLRTAPEADGSVPVFNQLIGGKVIQYLNTCNQTQPRSLAPDDANIDEIFRRWDIKRWEIQGAASDATVVENVFSIARDHKVLLDRFEAHLNIARSYVSYSFLLQMQQETFSYLTNTDVSISGQVLGTGAPFSASNVLLVSFVPDVDLEEPLNSTGTSSRILRTFSAVFESRINVAARSVSY